MESWKQYMFSLIVCSLICGIISQLLSDTKRKALMHLIFGTVLAITILRPLSGIHLDNSLLVPVLEQISADPYIAEGEKTALEAQERNIKDACEAYILDKAKALGAEITVHFSLNGDLVPVFVEISGETDPNVQKQLQEILMTDFDIPKENQKWTWIQESNSS